MNRIRAVWGMVIPRPHSFLINSLFFAGGILFAWLEGYRGFFDEMPMNMPAWLIILLWFLVQEVLVQQAKYMWNDLRDHEQDQEIPANRIRPIARRSLSSWTPIIMAGRWIFGIVLAGMLSPLLLTLTLMISGLQIVYELWAKPRSAAQPVLPMTIVGAGVVLKSGAGALAMGFPSEEQRFWLYGIALFATGVVFVSSFWRVETAYFTGRGLDLPRGQSAYFGQKGMLWLKAGTAVTIVACTVLIFDGYARFLIRVNMPTGLVLGLIMAAGILCCYACFLLVQGRMVLRIAVGIFFILGCAFFMMFKVESVIPVSKETLAATLLLVFLLIDHRLNVSMDYKQQNLIYLAENWPKLKRMALERPRRSNVLMHYRDLWQLFLALNTPKFDAMQHQQEGDWPTIPYLNVVESPVRKLVRRGKDLVN